MKENLTEVVFILDRSGSMSGLESDTIGGFNAMIEKQRKGDGEVLVSTVLFSDRSEVLHDRADVKDVKPLTEAEYSLRFRPVACAVPSGGERGRKSACGCSPCVRRWTR